MKQIISTPGLLVLFITLAFSAHAQTPAGVDMSKVQEQIKQAQALLKKKLSPDIQKK